MSEIKRLIKKEAKIIIASVIAGLILTVGVTTKAYSDKISAGISEEFIRFHVIANSDTDADQRLKQKVKDGVLKAIKDDIDACTSISETREVINQKLSEIAEVSEKIIKKEGYSYEVNVSLEKVLFPTKAYGDVVLAAGMYEALRIEIGEGNGKNWWCVVYPPLCYVDAAQGKVSESSKAALRKNLKDEEYKLVVQDGSVRVRVKFKIVEMWQESKSQRMAAFRR